MSAINSKKMEQQTTQIKKHVNWKESGYSPELAKLIEANPLMFHHLRKPKPELKWIYEYPAAWIPLILIILGSVYIVLKFIFDWEQNTVHVEFAFTKIWFIKFAGFILILCIISAFYLFIKDTRPFIKLKNNWVFKHLLFVFVYIVTFAFFCYLFSCTSDATGGVNYVLLDVIKYRYDPHIDVINSTILDLKREFIKDHPELTKVVSDFFELNREQFSSYFKQISIADSRAFIKHALEQNIDTFTEIQKQISEDEVEKASQLKDVVKTKPFTKLEKAFFVCFGIVIFIWICGSNS